MVWGGKYTYAAWWTDEPLQIQGINILPMTAASFYAAANKDFILTNWKTAERNEKNYAGVNEKNPKRWNEIWSEYLTMADPEQAKEYFDDQCDPEAGESKAHAYHWIMAMEKNGTPDVTVTSDNPLAAAFKNEDGDMTYVAYNTTDTAEKVIFSDGTEITAKPKGMTTTGDGEVSTKSTYKVEHYLSDGNGGYNLVNTESKSAKIGSEVTATAKDYPGYKLNESVEGTVKTGIVEQDGSLVLKLYYDVTEVQTTNAYQDDSNYTSLGMSNGVSISYKILRNEFGAVIKLLDANDTFYMEYQGTYTADNTQAFLNKNTSSSLTGVYKFSVKGTLKADTYNTIKLVSGDKQVYVLVKYGNPSGVPDLSDYESEQEETTADPNAPTNPIGLVVGAPTDNTVSVTFRSTQDQIEKGQVYNIYVDDVLKLASVTDGIYTINDVAEGKHTVTVKAVLNGKESDGVSATVKATGVKETTTKSDKPDETTTPKVTTSGSDETTPDVTTKGDVETTPEETSTPTICPTPATTKDDSDTTTEKVTTTKGNKTTKVKVGQAKIVKAKKVSKKKVKLTFKKISKNTGYQIKISTSKKFKKKVTITRTVKKNRKVYKLVISNKKLRKAKKLYVKARAFRVVNKKRSYGKWTKAKRIKK